MRKSGSIILVVVCAAGLFGAGTAGPGRPEGAARRAVAGAWTALGPEGGSVSGLARNPKAPSEIYALTPFGLVFRSGDNGASWTLRSRVSETSQSVFLDLKIDPLTPSTIFVLDSNAFAKAMQSGRVEVAP